MTILPTTTLELGRTLALAGRRGLLAAGLGLLGTAAVQAQALNYTPANAQNVAGTFTDITATGTAIATANTDDANSSALPLGFTFSFNGATFANFVLNTNGLIRLGTAGPSVTNSFPSQDQTMGNTDVDPFFSTDPADVNIIAPFNIDLGPGSAAGGAQYRYLTTGAAGSRVTTIQWKNVSDKPGTGTDMAATQYANFNFQVKLFEGSNNIEFVYGTATAGTGTATARFPNVGIKGSSATASVLANKTASSAAWSTTVFINGPYGTSTHNFRANVGPDLGRTYRFRPTLSTSVDAAVKVIYTLGQISQAFASPHTVRAVVTNNGGGALTNLPVTLTVTGANTFTNTQTVASLAAGATTTVTFAPYTLTATGTNTVTVMANATGDTTPANDAASSSQVVGNSLEYTDPAATAVFTGGLGTGAANSVLLVKYTVTAPTNVTAITPTFTAGMAGSTDTYQVQIYSATGTGAPGTVLYTSPARPRPAAAGADVVTITPTSVSGTFYVATKQLSATNIGLAYQTEDPLRAGTFFFSANGTAFTDLSTTTFPARLAIQATLSSMAGPCAPVTFLSAAATGATTARVFFNPGASNTSYTVTYTPTGGIATTVTPPPSASGFTISGLTANTTYTISVTASCGGTAANAVTTTVRTLPPAAPYAPVPYRMDFESTWLDVGAVRDAPGVNWRNNTATGDEAWRREDDGASANWTNIGLGVYTPNSSPLNGATGTHSARLHSAQPAMNGASRLTLALNLSQVGVKTLTFDYRNTNGLDSLGVFLSNDGGQTRTIIGQGNNNANWVTKTIPLNSTSATALLFFEGYFVNPNTSDIGIDNVNVSIVTGTRATLAGSALSLYPNPARHSFVLGLPALPSRTAHMDVINALGQVVRQQTVAAGTDTRIDAAGLNAGIYTVRVQSGSETATLRLVLE